jgi:hypothetical protein
MRYALLICQDEKAEISEEERSSLGRGGPLAASCSRIACMSSTILAAAAWALSPNCAVTLFGRSGTLAHLPGKSQPGSTGAGRPHTPVAW